MYTKTADVPVPGFRKYQTQKRAPTESEYHAITNKYPEAASVVQQICKIVGDIVNLAGCTAANAGTSIVNITENTANLCKAPDGKPLFGALYGMYAVTQNELEAILKMSEQKDKVVV